jgi:subtilisin family serine protease
VFLLVSRLPPTVAGIGLLLAHLAVFVDIALRRDLSWWRRIVDGVLVGLLLPLGALGYLLVRPIGLRMRRRVDRRQAARERLTGWRRSTARVLSVASVGVAFVASVIASAAAAPPPSPFTGEDYGIGVLNLPAAWPTSTGVGVTVAVVDSGVDATNPFLAPRLVPGHDLADATGSTVDGLGHGTHVAGIIAQAAPDARIMPVRVLDAKGHGTVSTIAAGVIWAADHGAAVINLSVDESGVIAQIQKEGSLNDAARYAATKGAVVIGAAGNESEHLQVYRPGVPVITVAAVDDQLHAATFTNWGGPAQVAAPGVDVWSTAPKTPTTLFPDGTDGTGQLSGTSMATPFVAGVAALLRANHATAPATQAALLASARSQAGQTKLGHGVVDAAAALSYARAHPNPGIASYFAPAWFRWAQLVLIVAVAAKYGWAFVSWLAQRHRRGPSVAAEV